MPEPVQLWRICRAKYAESAFSGEGSFRYPGRWNEQGVRMVYTSSSLALAALETFVHLDFVDEPDSLVSISAVLPPNAKLQTLTATSLPPDWNDLKPFSTRALGTAWLRSGRSLGLRVPSVMVRGEWNVLLNPAHRQFSSIIILQPQSWHFDSRMFRSR